MADDNLSNASDYLYQHLKVWYGDRWTVVYYYDNSVEWRTNYKIPNLCNEEVKQQSGKNLKVILFEHSKQSPKIDLDCNCWFQLLEIKNRKYSGNLTKAVEELHEDLRIWFPDSGFTVMCITDQRYGMIHSSDNICSYSRDNNNTTCYIYQH